MSIPQEKPSKVDKWLKGMKGSISLTASIIATMTFALATNPPGGVVQASLSDATNCSNVTGICVGEAILATRFHERYLAFLTCNTICFIASLSVILLLVSGISIDNRFTMWLLSIGMGITLTSLAFTYGVAANMVTPNSIWNSNSQSVFYDETVFSIAIFVWVVIVLLLYIVLIVRAFVKGVIKCCK